MPNPSPSGLRAFFRRRRKRKGDQVAPTWQDNMPTWDSRRGLARYLHIPEIDRWRAIPYDMPPAPERGTVLQRVRQLTESLSGAIDEGTGASLDRLIESWAGAWIATVDTEYADHCGVIDVHRGQALEWLTESSHAAEHAREEHDQARADYLACKRRLTGEPATTSPPAAELIPGEHDGAGTATGWVAPHLVAGRAKATLIAAGLLVFLGALTDTVAFQNTLQIALRTVTGAMAWLMAAGATSMALIAAGSLGVALAINRRSVHPPPRLVLFGAAAVWLGLGLAMFLVRWLDTAGAAGPSLGGAPAHRSSSIWIAAFFAAIYLISGACTLFEAERLYNPEYFAFLRLGKHYRALAERRAAAEAAVDRARAAVDLHDGELDREEQRRLAAIAERKALAAEAANHARILMAAMMSDPAKTGITETGPVPELPPPSPETRPGPGSAFEPGDAAA